MSFVVCVSKNVKPETRILVIQGILQMLSFIPCHSPIFCTPSLPLLQDKIYYNVYFVYLKSLPSRVAFSVTLNVKKLSGVILTLSDKLTIELKSYMKKITPLLKLFKFSSAVLNKAWKKKGVEVNVQERNIRSCFTEFRHFYEALLTHCRVSSKVVEGRLTTNALKKT